MKKIIILSLFFLFAFVNSIFSQTKVSGIILDKNKQPIPFANVVFKGTNIGTVSNEKGYFLLESPNKYTAVIISSAGFSEREIILEQAVIHNFKVILSEAESLKEVVLYTGKTSKKNNPALDILRKIWERKRKNGLYQFKQYQMEKYEKIEFDLNAIDSAYMKSRLFKGMEFIFKQMDTSKIGGKTFLPIFITESLYDVYGNNEIKKVKEILKGSKTSGFENNQKLLSFVKDLYSDDYNIYNNHLTLYDKSFTSPISTTGIDVYNYVLRDSTFVDKKWCYNIVYYPRRKNELTFKGDFWVSDTTFAIKKINMAVTKGANINWVKDIYLEQEFDVVNDSVFLLTKDYIMSDFALDEKGIYGKRTTYYRNHKFNEPKPSSFYREEVNFIDNEVYKRSDEFWKENRFEKLSKSEQGIYTMLDSLQTIKKFRFINDLISMVGSDYIGFPNFDFGPLLTTIGYNEVEKVRLRIGGRTYFGPNDLWRLQAYLAYGFGDDKFKYGVLGKWMIEKKNRIIISGGNRRDIEQAGAGLTVSHDIVKRSFASSSIFTIGGNKKLSNLNLTNFAVEIEPLKNLTFRAELTYTLSESAMNSFLLDYYKDLPSATNPMGITANSVKQSEATIHMEYTPNRKTIGFAVERNNVDNPFSSFFISYSQGFKGVLNSDFKYEKIQLFYKQPLIIGPLGRTNLTLEAGKTFGTVPLGLMSAVPGNPSYFIIESTFSNLGFYEFVTDQYLTLHWDHNFGGRFFSRIPFIRKFDLREVIGIKAVYGTISDANRTLNASGVGYNAPEKVYWEYNAGIANIFSLFRIDFSWRGNYLNMPDANRFSIKGSIGFYF